MNLTYNILWIENESEWYEETKLLVGSILEDEGFRLQTTYKKSESDIQNLIEKDGLKYFDLILVDLNLDNGDSGNIIIENIREHQIFTDIIFYSQNIEGIKAAIRKHELEGVYISKRDRVDFESKFEKVFKTTIKKIQDVSAIRGLVLAETSRLDRKIEEIIVKFYNCTLQENKTKILNYIFQKLVDSTKSAAKKAEKLKTETVIDKIINERIFDSYKKVQTVGEIVDIIKKPGLLAKKEFIDKYCDQVIGLRNNLAHVEESEDEKGNKVLKTHSGDFIMNDDKCKEIRSNIIKQDETLEKILSAIC